MSQDIAGKLDFANHHADATPEDVKRLCQHVLTYGFNAAFVNACYIAIAREELGDRAKVGCTISFPLGQDTLEMKIFGIREAIRLGADELDVGANNGLLLAENGFGQYRDELKAIVEAARSARGDVVVKFIIETGLFLPSFVPLGGTTAGKPDESNGSTDDRDRGEFLIKRAAEAILASGADFVKICSGLGGRGASLHDVKLVKEAVGTAPIRIKVAGGIDTLKETQDFLAAGALRIGTSHAVNIIEEEKSRREG